jgi:alpha-L-fucosidase
VILQEQIRESQRIEAFSLHAKTPGGWEKVFSGSTVGWKKICPFPPVEAAALRIVIEQSRVYPTLRFLQVL